MERIEERFIFSTRQSRELVVSGRISINPISLGSAISRLVGGTG